MKFYYKIYGLAIKSEIELPEAYEIEYQTEEVEIVYGVMPEFIKEKREQGYYSGVYFREYKWFYYEEEANFLMEKGKKITVEIDNTADEKHIRALLLGVCLGSIMYQRNILSIHGSAVVWNDKAIIVSGVSGAGKSTISTELRKKGGLLLADDTVAIASEDEIVYANPSFPQQKLCKDAAIKFGYDLKKLILLQENREKYAIELKDAFCPVRKEVSAFVCLDIHNGNQLIIEEEKTSKKLQHIIENMYVYKDLKNIGMNTIMFKKCLEVAQKVPVIRIERPTGKNVVERITEQIINIMESTEID